jgi:hypothetical protein
MVYDLAKWESFEVSLGSCRISRPIGLGRSKGRKGTVLWSCWWAPKSIFMRNAKLLRIVFRSGGKNMPLICHLR